MAFIGFLEGPGWLDDVTKVMEPRQSLMPHSLCDKGSFTNYVYKRRGVDGQKNQLFVNFYTVENVNGGG